jgi:hypothetical protein
MANASSIRIATTDDRKTVSTRTGRASIVGTMGPKSALYAIPEVKTAIDAIAADGLTLAAADTQVETDEAQVAKSRAARADLVIAFDSTLDVGVALVEKHATKPGDATDTGFVLFERSTYTVDLPASFTVEFDAKAETIDVHVRHAPGMHAVFVEWCADPVSATSVWKRIDGIAAEYHLTGFAPGRYWFRACSVRSAELSAWTTPVSVVVK